MPVVRDGAVAGGDRERGGDALAVLGALHQQMPGRWPLVAERRGSREPVSPAILEHMIDMRPQADCILIAAICGKARQRAP